MISSGELRRILERWGIWTQACAGYFGDRSGGSERPAAFEEYISSRTVRRSAWEKVKQYAGYLPLLGKGAVVTLELSVFAMALAVGAGLLIALSRLYANASVRALAGVYSRERSGRR